jgi:hypothetical protein
MNSISLCIVFFACFSSVGALVHTRSFRLKQRTFNIVRVQSNSKTDSGIGNNQILSRASSYLLNSLSVVSLGSLFLMGPQEVRAIDVLNEVIAPADSLRSDKASSFTQTTVILPSGVKYYDAIVGSGPAAKEGSTVQFVWVLRRSNGYFVDSNADFEPFIYKVGNLKKVIPGIDEGIRGMKQGGVRRLNIPPKMAFVNGVDDDKPGPIPNGFGPKRQILTRIDRETWYFEIKLVKLKE